MSSPVTIINLQVSNAILLAGLEAYKESCKRYHSPHMEGGNLQSLFFIPVKNGESNRNLSPEKEQAIRKWLEDSSPDAKM